MVLINKLRDVYEASRNISTLSLPALKENQLDIKFVNTVPDAKEIETVFSGQKPPLPFASSEPFEADIVNWRRLTAESSACKAVYEVTFNTGGSNFTFKPGDTIGIIPQNNKKDVNAIIELLDLNSKADQPYTLSVPTNQKGGKILPHVPIKSTIRHALTHCYDIRSVPKKLFLLALSRHTKDEEERKILEYFCSREGSTAYTTHILNQHFCLLDLLSCFTSCKPPIQVLLMHLPRLLPRPYSIVNSSVKNPNVIKICFSVMDIGNNRKGLVTGWLESLLIQGKHSIEDKLQSLSLDNSLNIKMPIFLRKNISGFSPSENLETPLILIGPGTGISPFIGFLEERHHLKEKSSDIKAGSVWLFFGCRNPKLDFIYEKELNFYLENKTITKLSTSFSRIENTESKYIQDALMQNGEEIVKLINNGAIIYICGDLKNMVAEIKEIIVNCLVKYNGKSEEEAKTFLTTMQAEKKFLVDVWS